MPIQREDTLGAAVEKLSSYSLKIEDSQAKKLRAWCLDRGWDVVALPHTRFAFSNADWKVQVNYYTNGKLLIQGRGTGNWVRDVLEAQITLEPKLGYERVLHPEWFEPHAGLDESGKGDFFGPLVSSCVIAGDDAVKLFLDLGVKDSKALSLGNISRLDKVIRSTDGVVVKSLALSMFKYNELYVKLGRNLNRLLGWQHAKCLENALREKQVSWGVLDKFSREPITMTFAKSLKNFDLQERVRAESDPVVAAASICARARYLREMRKLSKQFEIDLPRGCSDEVKAAGLKLLKRKGLSALRNCTKQHFKTFKEVLQAS